MKKIRGNHKEGTLGNTDTKVPKQADQLIRYCFTFNNYKNGQENTLEEKLKEICKKFIFQKETGKEGTKHLQGYIVLNKKTRITEFKKYEILRTCHFEKCKGNEKQNILYCSKEDTRDEGTEPYCYNITIPKKLKIIKDLHKWQQFVVDIIKKEPDERFIYWFYDRKGNIGKSSLAKYLCYHHKALFIDEGKKSDLMNLAFNTNWDETNCVILDVPRENGNMISYKSLESIKNGMICNTKYETGMKLFNAPHIIVFANSPPDIRKMSLDRWKVYFIEEKDRYKEFKINPEDYKEEVFEEI